MSVERVIVTLVGLGVSVFIVSFFFFSTRKGVKAETKGNYQEATVLVKGGVYTRCGHRRARQTAPFEFSQAGDCIPLGDGPLA